MGKGADKQTPWVSDHANRMEDMLGHDQNKHSLFYLVVCELQLSLCI
jgi:hypothetical protein